MDQNTLCSTKFVIRYPKHLNRWFQWGPIFNYVRRCLHLLLIVLLKVLFILLISIWILVVVVVMMYNCIVDVLLLRYLHINIDIYINLVLVIEIIFFLFSSSAVYLSSFLKHMFKLSVWCLDTLFSRYRSLRFCPLHQKLFAFRICSLVNDFSHWISNRILKRLHILRQHHIVD